ncbi:MAG: adenosylmethionine--8-amino-7-oxononanoate transaminase [Zetaproteobacteria bacterium CG2_30_46_52]|nr:MAG: adenosylmethionine--8-amino-7-oxononanoate transaminase [Zetaproteobacteria bacterium CG2_30_46_52]
MPKPDLNFEQKHVWHPYASMLTPAKVYAVASASGVTLTLADGRQVLDGMSSWWCAIHGYNVPELNEAVNAQLQSMAHVMFGGLTHQPAIDLAKTLLDITPNGLEHIFFADSGSVSVEVALKMAVQYWRGLGQSHKSKFLSLRHAYHGDTFGAMSVCDPVTSMHHLFAETMPKHYFADVDIQSIRAQLNSHHQHIAALIIEPIVQGAGGMHFYSPELLGLMREVCDEFDVLLIADEIATGFGRTGELFACNAAHMSPDIMCVGKALTGGYMTLAATLCSQKVSNGIHQQSNNVLMHGPTFMANPLACAVAKASLDLLLASPWQQRIKSIEQQLIQGLAPAKNLAQVADVRVLGAIGVIEMTQAIDINKVQDFLIRRGIWLRPFGKLLYTMPPFVMNEEQISQLTRAMCAAAALK